MNPIATYSFLPWLRQGIAGTITALDGDQTASAARATTHVALELTGTPVAGGATAPLTQTLAQDIELYGPGDVIGLDTRAIVRTEPRDRVTNFEANYLPAIDFYDEDLPWRYTPAAATAGRLQLRPWIALVVLTEEEFADGRNLAGRPLPYISIPDASVLPPAGGLWAWAHVHLNGTLAGAPGEVVSADVPSVVARAKAIVDANPDAAYSRLMCPRKLKDDTGYHAFVVPAFESGRLAGLGLDPALTPYATAPAWGLGGPQADEHPVYHRWFFRTGSHGDFEYLVRLLAPQPVDPHVGVRPMDVQDPGANLPGIPDLGGILRLGGALQVPKDDLDAAQLAEREQFESWDAPFPHAFETALAAFVNLPDDYAAQAAADANAATGLGAAIEDDPDPLITAPLYGRWHARTQRLLSERDGTPAAHPENWVHRLNLDPRFRVPAGFGADVVETNAESYMDDAWQQIGDVLAANLKIRRLHLAAVVASRWYDRHLVPLVAAAPERALTLTAPVHGRIVTGGATVAHQRAASLVPPVLTSTALRRAARPGGRLMRGLPFDERITRRNLLERVNAGAVAAAPPKAVPSGVVTVDDVAAAAAPAGVPPGVLGALATLRWLPWALIALGVVLLVVLPLALGLVALLVLVALALLLLRWRRPAGPGAAIDEEGQAPGATGDLPDNPNWTPTVPGSPTTTPPGPTDSAAAGRFKAALEDLGGLFGASATAGAEPERRPIDLGAITGVVVKGVDPTVTIPRRGFSTIALPPWVVAQQTEDFGEVMAYPKIDLPMYQPLKAISVELFLPNINLIPPNSITLVETHQRFIEAYMVGLNHELARKLLWREYPTDQRGSYFRQFWDVRSAITPSGLSANAAKEQLYDIPELHTWPSASALGTHDHRQPPGEQEGEQAVLVIRGELLKKYPTAVVYAHRAQWEFQADGVTPDLTKPRILAPLTPAEELDPPPAKVRPTMFEAKAEPDIYFFGFDLTIPEAKGGTGEPPETDAGWFFIIKERPGEPRFGLDTSDGGGAEVFDELSWQDGMPGGQDGGFLSATALAPAGLIAPPAGDPEGKGPQHADDAAADLAAPSAARWAYLLFRAPVMVAIHAREMLR